MFSYRVLLLLNKIEDNINTVNISKLFWASLMFTCSLSRQNSNFYFSIQIKNFIQHVKML